MAEAPIPKRVLVIGATGLIGKDLLDGLIDASSSFEKIGIFTSQETAEKKSSEIQAIKEKGVQVEIGNVSSEEDVKKAYGGYDTVISALGRNVILGQIPLIDLAEASPTIHTFYPSEYGTDIEYGPQSATERPNQMKLQVRKHIRNNTKKLKVSYLVTGPYSEFYVSNAGGAYGGFDVKTRKAVILGTGKDKVSFTTMRDVAKLLVAALRTPTSAPERILRVNSFTTTSDDILAEFEKQTGAKWEASYISAEEVEKIETELWEQQHPLATAITLRRIWLEGATLYEERDNGKIGEPVTESLEEQVRKAMEKGS